jgi:hypothetical protein
VALDPVFFTRILSFFARCDAFFARCDALNTTTGDPTFIRRPAFLGLTPALTTV